MKTITINGKRYSAKDVIKQMTPDNETTSGDYLVVLGGVKFGANYYYNTDAYYIPDDIAPDGVWLEGRTRPIVYLSL